MGVDLIRVQPEHIGELGRILYEAFKHIADKHHFPPFFPSVALAREVIGGLVQRTDIWRALKAGCRPIEVMNLMAAGQYEPPGEVWMPSVTY